MTKTSFLTLLVAVLVSDVSAQILGFFPKADTVRIRSGCSPPVIRSSLENGSMVDTVAIVPGFNTNIWITDSSGRELPVQDVYFLVLDSLNSTSYELWVEPAMEPPGSVILVPFDSTIVIEPGIFNLKLRVRRRDAANDSLSQMFTARSYPLSVRTTWGRVGYRLDQNFPNPFNSGTTIRFTLEHSGQVSLKVCDLLGEEIATLISEELPSGIYHAQWNAGGLPSGVYFYRLQTAEFLQTRKLQLLK
jgi:hypothetical protein